MLTWFRNVKIRNKFFLVFGAFSLLVASVITYTLVSINELTTDYMRITDGPNKRLLLSSYATAELSDIRKSNVSMGASMGNAEAARRFFVLCNNSNEKLLKHLDHWQLNLEQDLSMPDKERAVQLKNLDEVRKKLAEYMGYVKETYEALVLMPDRQKVAELSAKCGPIGDQLVNQLGTNRNSTEDYIISRTNAINEKAWVTSIITAILAIFILVFSLTKDLIISYLITSPIGKINKSINEIEKGNLRYPVRLNYRDELGQLSNHIGDMVDRISEMNSSLTILDHVEVLTFVTDLEYNIIFANNHFARFNGLERSACIGRKCYTMFGEDQDEPCPFCPLPEMYPKRESYPLKEWERPLTVDGENVWYACRSSINRWTDGTLVHFNVYRDETAQKQHADELCDAARLAEEASRVKSSFLANMSHEIRTPMNSIIGFSELALGVGDVPIKVRDYLDKIKTSSEGLLGIINDILDISKIEAGKIVLESIPFNLHEVFKMCQNIITPRAAAKGITLFCYSEPTLGKKLLGDPVRLRQVLLNLLTNAVKFTNNGMVKVVSSITGSAEDGSSVTIHFEVKDNGIGMSEEQITKVFDPFTQADNSTTRKYGGTGLGLTITKNFVEMMGGKLHVESTVGLGSKFSFDLPFPTSDQDAEPESAGEMDGIVEMPKFDGEILVCEDNEMNQIVITDHLSRVGIKTIIAENGKVGVDIVASRMERKEKLFNLIFMDVHMPVMDGLEAVQKLTEMGNTIPIVALTANIMTTDRETYRKYGMNEYLPKPFTARELWSCLLKYIKPADRDTAVQIVTDGAFPGGPQTDEDHKLHMRLITNFLKNNRFKDSEIRGAIASRDIKLAHRLAHTIKGVAGLVGQPGLQSASFNVEHALSSNDIDNALKLMAAFETELKKSIRELTAVKNSFEPEAAEEAAAPPAAINKLEALELIDKIRPMLENGDPDCLELVEGLKAIPASKELIEHIENYDFDPAMKTLERIREELGA
ncbi:MAG: ATP-binding protein [Chitinispirillia bacterium]|nr:ATP-binding protein [Chitinispirillia bacterium]MCL2268406.1 ATP-binding protein [Chitinispirillia bacterium]